MGDTPSATVALLVLSAAFMVLLLVQAWLVVSVLRVRGPVVRAAQPAATRPAARQVPPRQPLRMVPSPYDDPEAPPMVVNSTASGVSVQDPEKPAPRTDDLGGAGISDAAEQMWQDVRHQG